MSNLQSEVFEAFRAIDVPEDKAMAAASALARRDDDVTALKGDIMVLKWIAGFNVALSVAILLKEFLK